MKKLIVNHFKKVISAILAAMLILSAIGGQIFAVDPKVSMIKQVNSALAESREDAVSLSVKTLSSIEEFKNYDVRSNSVLILERYLYHHECMPGYIKYFSDLGFNVDVLLRSGQESSISGLTDSKYEDRIRVFALNSFFPLNTVAEKSNFYKHILINTADNFDKKNNLENIRKLDNVFFVFHHQHKIPTLERVLNDRIITLGNFKFGKMVNPHHFCDSLPFHIKNKLTRFVVVGRITKICRNYALLIDSMRKLVDDKKDFEVISFGWIGKLKTSDPEINKRIKSKGRLTHGDMYKEVKNSDFILALLDPNIQEHKRYLKNRVSGTFQLAYGFHKILLIDKEFANNYGFNDQNSIIYTNNTLCDAMLQAIDMDQEEYSKKQKELSDLATSIYNKSIKNLKNMCYFQDKHIKIKNGHTKPQKAIDDGTYTISSKLDPNKCLDIKGGSKNNCANLQLWRKNMTNAQKFKVLYQPDGYYTIQSVCSGKFIDVAASGKQNVANIQQYQGNGTDAQKWFIIPDGEGHFYLISKCNNLCMDVCGGKAKDGANIHCWNAHGGDNQRFKFEKCEDKSAEVIKEATKSSSNKSNDVKKSA